MLDVRTVLRRDGVEISDVLCSHRRGRGDLDEQVGGHAIVFVRRGCFVRRADGLESVLDPTVAYCMNPGEEQRYDHPHDGGDECTSIFLEDGLLASLWGGDPTLPGGVLASSPEIDLRHRLLLAASDRGLDPQELVERTISLVATTLEQADPRRVAAGRPGTLRARRVLVDGTREMLAGSPDRSLPELARSLTVSPHHLSRVFRAETGHTISRHRLRLRVRAALERLAGGERNLARLSAELGFADQSHLCRAIRRETGRTPSSLRALLSRP